MKPDSIFEKIVALIYAVLFMVALCGWTVKGWQYLDAKTRDVSLNADYTEQMLKMYRD